MDSEGASLDQAIALVADPTAAVGLHRLVHAETDRVLAVMRSEDFAPDRLFDDEELARRVVAYEELMQGLGSVAGAGAYWGMHDAIDLWVAVIERLAARPDTGLSPWLDLWRYPALLALYAAGVGATARRRYRFVRSILSDVVVEEHGRLRRPLDILNPWAVADLNVARRLPGLERRKTPLNDRISETLRLWLALPVPDDRRYERAFDEFEYLLGLLSLDGQVAGWAPPGRFSWKRRGELDPGTLLAADVAARGSEADVLAAGLFGGSVERFDELRSKYAEQLVRSGVSW